MNISRISISRKSVWDTCKQQYKFKYHLKTPSPEEEPEYFIYGKIIHKIAQEYVANKAKINILDIKNEVFNGKISLGKDLSGNEILFKELSKEYVKKIPEHLSSIVELTEKIGTDGYLEYEFNYDLDPPNNKLLNGFIDRLVVKDDNYCIIDYKTSKDNAYRKDEFTISSDLQLRCYARIVQKQFNVPANKIIAGLYYLQGKKLIGCKFSEESLVSAEQELLKAFKEIESCDAESVWAKTGWHCKRCDYRSICAFYKSSN